MGESADVQPYGVRRRHPVRQFRQPHDAGRPGTWLQPFSGRLKQTWNNSTASRNRPHSLTCTVTVWHSLTSASEPARAPLLAQIRLSYNPTEARHFRPARNRIISPTMAASSVLCRIIAFFCIGVARLIQGWNVLALGQLKKSIGVSAWLIW